MKTAAAVAAMTLFTSSLAFSSPVLNCKLAVNQNNLWVDCGSVQLVDTTQNGPYGKGIGGCKDFTLFLAAELGNGPMIIFSRTTKQAENADSTWLGFQVPSHFYLQPHFSDNVGRSVECDAKNDSK